MAISRRSFLQVGALAGMAVPSSGVLSALDFASRSEPALASKPDHLTWLTKSSFYDQLHTTFKVRSERAPWTPLQLIEITDLAPGASHEAFSLIFLGGAERPLGQDTYRIKQAQLGSFDMLLVPVGRAQSGQLYYEAVVNRLG